MLPSSNKRRPTEAVLSLVALALALWAPIRLQAEEAPVRPPAAAAAPSTADQGPERMPTSATPDNLDWFRKYLTVPGVEVSATERSRIRDAIEGMKESRRGTWPAPPSAIASPSGYGCSWSEVFFGASVQNRPRFRNKANGTGYVGFGMGNPRDYVGLEASIGIYGLIPPGERGGLNLKMHRMLGNGMGVAVGWDNVFVWGGADAKPAYYFAMSKTFNLRESVFDPFSQLTLHAGIGNGGYRSEADVFADKPGIGWFASAGLRVLAPVGLILNWSGQDLFAGISFTPSNRYPISVTFAAQDLTHTAGNGVRYLVNIAYTESIWRLPGFH